MIFYINIIQYGFRKKHSTVHPILQLINDISNSNDKTSKDITLAIFLNLSKAFDTISHNILIHKLGICKSWFTSYLANLSQYTEINGYQSTHLNINTRVPQGSILGPILFLIYIIDISKCSSLKLLCFADDTTAYTFGSNIKDLFADVNAQLKQIFIWLSCNKLSLNGKKTSYTLFRHIDRNNELFINNEKIINSEDSNQLGAIKFLGIYIDKHLTWKQHVDFLCSTISKSIFALNKVKHFMPLAALKSLYFALIHSRLQYGIESWGNSNNIYKLFRMRKRAIRVINNKKYRHHTDPLFKINNIMKVSDLYKQHVFLFMYDLINNNLPASFKDFSILENANR